MALLLFVASLRAQESALDVTYDHHLEEPGSLEVALRTLVAPSSVDGGRHFVASSLELEYGARGWWTTELYLDGQATAGQATAFTGARWENRFRPLLREHAVNPVLYVELEDTHADKTM